MQSLIVFFIVFFDHSNALWKIRDETNSSCYYSFFQHVCSCLRDFLSAGYALLHVLDTVEESKNFWNAEEWRCYDYLPDLEYRVVRVPASRVGYMVPPSELVFLAG